MAWKLVLAAGLCTLTALGCGVVEADAVPRGTDAPGPPSPPPAPLPAPFTRMSYVEAKHAARGSGRFLVVEFVVPWSSSCKMMDKTTWSDSHVADWIHRRAIAVRLDALRNKTRSRELGVKHVPTVIVFVGDREVDRLVGYETPQRFVRWLEATRERARFQ